MKVILKIGYMNLLMPSTAAAERVMSGLSKAVEFDCEYKNGAIQYYPKVRDRERFGLSMELVPDEHVHKRKPLLDLPGANEAEGGIQ